MVDAFHSRRDLVVGLLKEIPGIKSMFQKVLLCIPRRIFVLRKTLRGTLIKDANDFAMYLLGKLMWRP
jgi:aspartate aminotransferase